MRNRLKQALIMVPVLLVLTLFLCLALLPRYLESSLIPALAGHSQLSYVSAQVRKLDWAGLDLSNVRIGSGPEQIAMSADSIRIDFRLADLFSKRISRIVVGAPELKLNYAAGRFSLPGFTPPTGGNGAPPLSGSKAAAVQLPVKIGEVRLKAGLISVHSRQGTRRFPFELELLLSQANGNAGRSLEEIRGRFKGFFHDDPIAIDFVARPADNLLRLALPGSSVELSGFTDYLKAWPGLVLSGELAIKAEADLRLQPFTLRRATASATARKLRGRLGRLEFGGSGASQAEPLSLAVDGQGDDWQLKLSGLELTEPLPLHLARLQSQLKLRAAEIQAEGSLHATLFPKPSAPGKGRITVLAPVVLQNTFTVGLDRQQNWHFSLQNDPAARDEKLPPNIELGNSELSMQIKPPALAISGQGDARQGALSYTLQFPGLAVTSRLARAEFEQVGISGAGQFRQATAPFSLDADLNMTGGQLTAAAHELKAEGVTASMPLSWPLFTNNKRGKLELSNLFWQSKDLGPLTISLHGHDQLLDLRGQHQNRLIPGLVVEVTGRLKSLTNDAATDILSLTIPRFQLADFSPAPLVPSLQGLLISGDFFSQADFSLSNGRLQGDLKLTCNQGALHLPEQDGSLTGLEFNLRFPKLPQLRSAPTVLHFAELAAGKRKIANGEIHFQIESPQALLIEKSRVAWAGGHLQTNALRIQPAEDSYTGILFADGLRLADLLAQFGLREAGGKGTVNGQLPFSLENGAWRFEQGFLFSTPGEGGTIHVGGTDLLLAGVPENTPQFHQLDLASEALKNFDYDWAKLYLVSEQDELVLQVKLNGRPATPLPFAFNPRLGAFTRTTITGSGGIRQPLRLDVNLRVPLATILGYGKEMKKIRDRF